MDNLLSANVLSVIVAYLLTLIVLRMAVAGIGGGTAVSVVGTTSSTDTDAEVDDRRPERRSLTLFAVILPVLGILWAGMDTTPWTDMFGEGLSDLGYVLGLAMFFPRSDIIGLGTRRAKLWTAMGSLVLGSVLLYVPRFAA